MSTSRDMAIFVLTTTTTTTRPITLPLAHARGVKRTFEKGIPQFIEVEGATTSW